LCEYPMYIERSAAEVSKIFRYRKKREKGGESAPSEERGARHRLRMLHHYMGDIATRGGKKKRVWARLPGEEVRGSRQILIFLERGEGRKRGGALPLKGFEPIPAPSGQGRERLFSKGRDLQTNSCGDSIFSSSRKRGEKKTAAI